MTTLTSRRLRRACCCGWRPITKLFTSLAPLLVVVGTCLGSVPVLAKDLQWVVYYGAEAPAEAFDLYDLIVLESFEHPPLQPLKDRGATVLGYLSVGEVERQRPYFAEIEAQNLLIHESPTWPGSFSIDVRDPKWTKRVIEDLIPFILHQGFDGVMLDTLDNPPDLERKDPRRFAGMTPATARLVRTIRRHYPDIKIMVNRAYEILPEIGGDIDYVLGESVYAGYDFSAKKPRRIGKRNYDYQVEILKRVREQNPQLQIMTLDYWDPADTEGTTDIYTIQRSNGFAPYVSTIELNRIIKEPGR